MELGSIGSRADALPQVLTPRESEATERVPDNEASESARAPAKAPLPSHEGTVVDTQA
jgi:hypothetical protein